MKSGLVLTNDDIKHILAKYFGVNEKNVYKIQYSWIVATDEIAGDKNGTSISLEWDTS